MGIITFSLEFYQKLKHFVLLAALPNLADCSFKTKKNIGSLRPNGIGHIVIIKEFLNQPTLLGKRGDGLQQIEVMTMEASGSGAVNRVYSAQLIGKAGSAGSAASAGGFIRLHLIELHPGRDPDTQQGLRNLNIRNALRNLLKTPNDRAAKRKLTHNPNGTRRTDNQCCYDNHPAPPTQGSC